MSDGTVAPKERVNIVYKADTGGMQEEVELPLRLLVVGDFSGREKVNDDDQWDESKTKLPAVEKRDVINIDKDTFQEVLKGHEVVLHLDDRETKRSTVLRIENLDDFEPDNIVHNVPEMRQLMEVRKALIELKGPLDQHDALRDRLQELLKSVETDESRRSILDDLEMGSAEEKK